MYGQRRDPARAAARVGVHLGDGLEDVLRALRETLRLPYAAIRSDDRLVASVGEPPAAQHVVPLATADAAPAELVVGLRADESR